MGRLPRRMGNYAIRSGDRMTRPGLIRQYNHDETECRWYEDESWDENGVIPLGCNTDDATREEKVLACWRERKEAMRQGVTR